jgi:BolA protein
LSAADADSGEARRARLEQLLRDGLAATEVTLVDESHLHAGHAGAREGGGHFRARIVSPRFAGLSAVARQRLVYGVLGGEMGTSIHAFAMETRTPDE